MLRCSFCYKQRRCTGNRRVVPSYQVTVCSTRVATAFKICYLWLQGRCCLLVQADTTEYRRLGGFINKRFISPSSGKWEVQDQGAHRFIIWWESIIWFRDSPTFSLCPHLAEGARELSEISFIKALIPFMMAPPSSPKHLPKAPLPNTITLERRCQHMDFKGNTIACDLI